MLSVHSIGKCTPSKRITLPRILVAVGCCKYNIMTRFSESETDMFRGNDAELRERFDTVSLMLGNCAAFQQKIRSGSV
jgi:hypothetical protein